MKFLDKYSDSTIRAVFILLALYAFVIISISFINIMITQRQTVDGCLWLTSKNNVKPDSGIYIVQITPGDVADEAGLKDGDILLRINGETFTDDNDAQRILNNYKDETVEYTILRDGQVFNVSIWVYKFFNKEYLIFSLLAYSFLFIGFIVGYSKPKEFISQLFFLLGLTSMGLLFFANINYGTINIGTFLFYNYLTGIILFPSLFLHFVLTYPIKYKFSNRTFTLTLLYLINLVPTITNIFIRSLFDGNDTISGALQLVLLLLYIISGVVIFIVSYFKLKNPSLKKSLRIILGGFVLGILGFLYYYLTFKFIVTQPSFLVNSYLYIPAILVLAIPLSFGYSIFKYRILDTEFIVKRGLVFGIITTFIIGIYLLIVFLLNSVLSKYFIESRQLLTIATIVIITFTFDYVNRKAKDFVDKQFYRERYNYRKSLLIFSEELPYINNVNEILKKISASVHETMGIKNINVHILDRDYASLIDKNYDSHFQYSKEDASDVFGEALLELFSQSKSPKLLYEANLAELTLSQRYKKEFRDAEVVLSIPIFLKDRLIGSLNFGNKPSGKAYSEEDIDLLKTLASQSAIAFENARLQHEEVNKKKIEEELKIAKNIQNSLLPKEETADDRLEISWLSKPAKFIGGDFYDLIKIDEDKFLVVVADVSGKGVPAALYMSKVQAMIQFAASIFKTPRQILIEVNKQILEKIDKKSFVTIITALFDLKENKVTIARAGHNPALFSQNGSIETLKSKGIGLGLCEHSLFELHLEESTLPIGKDNLFLLYSDGLTEAMNSRQEEYGMEKLTDILTRNRDQSTDQILSQIMQSVDGFTKNAVQHDDITLVVVKTK